MNLFDDWNQEKQLLHERGLPKFFVNLREIWFTKMGKNIGFEADGKKEYLRPVLVLKKVGSLFLTVALTSKGKTDHRFYHKIVLPDLIEKNRKYAETCYVVLSQIRIMDKRRFTQNIGTISENEFKIIQKKLKDLMF